MAITTTFILPLSLTVFGNLLAGSPTVPAPHIQNLQQETVIQCTEVLLEYKTGIKRKSTTSKDCT